MRYSSRSYLRSCNICSMKKWYCTSIHVVGISQVDGDDSSLENAVAGNDNMSDAPSDNALDVEEKEASVNSSSSLRQHSNAATFQQTGDETLKLHAADHLAEAVDSENEDDQDPFSIFIQISQSGGKQTCYCMFI